MSDELDLSAWDVPPPPADLADVVIGRVAKDEAPVGVAVEPREPPRRRHRVLLIAGVAAATVAAAGTYMLVRSSHHAAPASGEIVVERPRALSLDGTRATLDTGASVQWYRKSDALHVAQRGTATWQVERDQKLMIDAAVASIEATGASLRVEVHMNSADAKIVGASAITSMAVAMVTVVVYEGYVKVRDHAQTVVVQPGSTFQTKAPDLVGVAPPAPPAPPVTVDNDKCDEVSCVLNNYAGACCARYQTESLDRSAIQQVMLGLQSKTEACATKHHFTGKLTAHVKVDREGTVVQVKTELGAAAGFSQISECISDAIKTATFQKTRNGATFTYPFTFYAFDMGCDATALNETGMEQISAGQHAAALKSFEASLACKPDGYVRQLAFMEACTSHNAARAKLHYKQLSSAQQNKFSQICIRNRTEYRDADEDDNGTLVLRSNPPAKIEIDHADTGKTTPAELSLAPGKHRVTLVVGVDKFTYSVLITAGKTATMSKQLE